MWAHKLTVFARVDLIKKKDWKNMESSAKLTLKLDGDFYPNFIKDKDYSNEALRAIKETVRKLLEQPTSVNRPGMLLGKVQSGKTKTWRAGAER